MEVKKRRRYSKEFKEDVVNMIKTGDERVPERFFRMLKTELVKRRKYEYIEIFYNKKGIHSAIGYLSLVEFKKTDLSNSKYCLLLEVKYNVSSNGY